MSEVPRPNLLEGVELEGFLGPDDMAVFLRAGTYSSYEIGQELGRSEETIGFRMRRIRDKFWLEDAQDVRQLAEFYQSKVEDVAIAVQPIVRDTIEAFVIADNNLVNRNLKRKQKNVDHQILKQLYTGGYIEFDELENGIISNNLLRSMVAIVLINKHETKGYHTDSNTAHIVHEIITQEARLTLNVPTNG